MSEKKKVEVVRPDYQPSKKELEEDMRVDLNFEELAQAVLQDAEVCQTDKPIGKRNENERT